ncbi:unnamed protein product [Scytosiphon promiscuus]
MARTALGLRALYVVATAAVARGFLPTGNVQNFATRAAGKQHVPRGCADSTWRPAPVPTASRSARLGSLRMSDSVGMDTIINDLKATSDIEMLTLKVSKCVKQVAQPAFFLRLAELAENAEDAQQRVELERLATQVTGVLEKLVEFAEQKMDDSSSLLQIVVTSAAEKNGEFLVPLSEERLAALRQSIKIHRDQLDNNFLATVQAWMEKSGKEEGMEGMVVILQKVLQMYASQEILLGSTSASADASAEAVAAADAAAAAAAARRTPAQLLLEEVLLMDADKWDGVLTSLSAPGRSMTTGGVTKEGLMGAIQVAVEKVILQQENGSMAQRVQAEFLSELCRRIEAACPDQSPGVPPGMFE